MTTGNPGAASVGASMVASAAAVHRSSDGNSATAAMVPATIRVASARWRMTGVSAPTPNRSRARLPTSRPSVTNTMAWLTGVDRSRPDTAP